MSQNELSTDNGKRGKMTKLKKMSIFYFLFFFLFRKYTKSLFCLEKISSFETFLILKYSFFFFVSVGCQKEPVGVVGSDVQSNRSGFPEIDVDFGQTQKI